MKKTFWIPYQYQHDISWGQARSYVGSLQHDWVPASCA
ncbi:hypothetical protein PAMC26510_24660 [Caballeronia sordidicola]|uniref:Uncharacterized protein n=1 Tax=Caballeronia sordidicola TaxID=196367 RepID=A0A242N3E0_CABSO|nr:hypothetical protein PAMC26510_24660 [Caballeronia sordidicola]OTP78093.1 hypothetical protein PAMC26577_05540 [Caballeronia sordidicola]